jgi:hypothetical protein
MSRVPHRAAWDKRRNEHAGCRIDKGAKAAPLSLSDCAKQTILGKKLVRREQPDRSRTFRHIFQCAFLLLNAWIGGLFYFWARGFESGTPASSMARPAGIEGWLPIAGMMNFKYWLTTGRVPATHPAAMFLFIRFRARDLPGAIE